MGTGRYRGPKYLRWRMSPDGINVRWGGMDNGEQDGAVMLVWIDADEETHALFAKNADVQPVDDPRSVAIEHLRGQAGSETRSVQTFEDAGEPIYIGGVVL